MASFTRSFCHCGERAFTPNQYRALPACLGSVSAEKKRVRAHQDELDLHDPSRGRHPPTPGQLQSSEYAPMGASGRPAAPGRRPGPQVDRERHEVPLQPRLPFQNPVNGGSDLTRRRRIELEQVLNLPRPHVPAGQNAPALPPAVWVAEPPKRTPSGHSATPCSIRIDASSSKPPALRDAGCPDGRMRAKSMSGRPPGTTPHIIHPRDAAAFLDHGNRETIASTARGAPLVCVSVAGRPGLEPYGQ